MLEGLDKVATQRAARGRTFSRRAPRERHVPAKMLGTYFAYLRGRACVWEEGSYDV